MVLGNTCASADAEVASASAAALCRRSEAAPEQGLLGRSSLRFCVLVPARIQGWPRILSAACELLGSCALVHIPGFSAQAGGGATKKATQAEASMCQ